MKLLDSKIINAMSSECSVLFLIGILAIFGMLMNPVKSALELPPLQVQTDSRIINTIANYTIEFDRTQNGNFEPNDYTAENLAASDNITITFPNDYSLAVTQSSITCLVKINSGVINSRDCSLQAGTNQLVITGAFATQTDPVASIQVRVSNILNPSPAGNTGNFIGTVGPDTSSITSNNNYIILQPDQFKSCAITFSPTIVNTTSAMIVSVQAKNPIPISGSIVIEFENNKWTNDVSQTITLPINNGIMNCISQSSNIQASLSCTGNPSLNKITSTDLFASELAANQTFSFSVNDFLSPPTNQPSDAITVTSYDSGSKIDTCSTYVTGLTPEAITTLQIASSDASQVAVNSPFTMKFTYDLVDTMNGNDYITVQFPAQTIMAFDPTTLNGNPKAEQSTTTYGIDDKILTIYFRNKNRNYYSGASLILIVGVYTAPPSTRTTEDFTLTVLRNGYPLMSGTATFTAHAGTLTGTSSMADRTVNTQTPYTLQLTITDALTSSGKIRITIPGTIKIATTLTTCAQIINGDGVNKFPICAFNLTEHSVTLTSLNQSNANIGAQTFGVVLNGLENPESIATTDPWQINTYYDDADDSLVASGTLPGVTPQIAVIDSNQVTVTPSELIVNESPITYQFKMTVRTNRIPAQGSFLLYIPPEVTIIDRLAIQNSCQISINGGSFSSTTCTVLLSNTTHQIIQFSTPFTTQSIEIGDYFTARIQNSFKNPPSTAPTSSFGLRTVHSDGYDIALINSALSVQMDTAGPFQNLQIARNSDTNYDLCTYTFSITQQSAIEASGIILITFAANVQPSTTVENVCTKTAPSPTQVLECSYATTTRELTINMPSTGAIGSSETLTITVSNIYNPASFEESGTFNFQTKTANSLYLYSAQSYNPNLTNTVPSNFEKIGYSFSPLSLGSPLHLQINFDPSDSGVVPDKLILTLANTFVIDSLSCNAFDDVVNGACQSDPASPNTVNVTGTFVNSQMNFSITGFVSPITEGISDYSTLISLDSNDYKLDQSSTEIIFVPECTLPCRTCTSASLPTQCLSCYSNTTITPNIYLDSQLLECYQNCIDGKWQNSTTNLCILCDSNCQTCENSQSFCTSCVTNSTYKYLSIISVSEQLCVSKCSQGLYPDSTSSITICTACQSPCATCTEVNICLSCVTGSFFLQSSNSCSSSCPSGTYIENSGTNNCDPCDISCATCSINTTNCITCATNYSLYNNTCLEKCPFPLVPQSGECGPCDSNCKNCVNNPFNCTSCVEGSTHPFLHEDRCLSNCPQEYYDDIGTGTCKLCSSVPNLNCTNCSSASTCYNCNPGYVLHDSQDCHDYVRDGFVNISGVAVQCAGDCGTCSVSPTNCNSCKNNFLQGNQCLPTCISGYVGINKICQACRTPCKTCSATVDNCQSCLTNLTPQVYYVNNECLTTCPNSTYPSTTNNVCENCVTPCQFCQTAALCLTCLSGFFLEGTSCVDICSSGTTGVSRLCQPCTANCLTCQNSTSLCTSCVANTYLMRVKNSCQSSCDSGLFIDDLAQECVYCAAPCKTCEDTQDTCLSCLTGVLFNGQCHDSCYSNYYNQSSICLPCLSGCAECTSLTVCTRCSGTSYLYNGYCISECPATHSIVINNQCTRCTNQYCYECTSVDICTSCVNHYSLLTGTCLEACPSGYNSNGTHCEQLTALATTSSSNFPVPFSIATIVFLIACLMSKLQFDRTYLPGAAFALLGLLEWGALVLFLYLYLVQKFNEESLPFFIGAGALGYLYLLNLFGCVSQNYMFCMDKPFRSWVETSGNKCSAILFNILATLTNHKLRNILFCKLFTFSIFSASLETVSKFKILNIFSFLSLLHSGGAIFAASVAIQTTQVQTQLYYGCIDVIVVTSLNVILSFFNVIKSKNFFFERTVDGFDLNKKIKFDDDECIEEKITPDGEGREQELGNYSRIARFYDVEGSLASNQPFKFRKGQTGSDISEIENSYGSLIENQKQYEEMSIQAVEIINDKFDEPRNPLDFSTIQHSPKEKNSNYTMFFQGNDKGTQNTMEERHDYGKEVQNSTSHYPKEFTSKSAQLSVIKGAEQSAQVNNSLGYRIDRSVQRTVFSNEDLSQKQQYRLSTRDQGSMRGISDKRLTKAQVDESVQAQLDSSKSMSDWISKKGQKADAAHQTSSYELSKPTPQGHVNFDEFDEEAYDHSKTGNIIFQENNEEPQNEHGYELAEERGDKLIVPIETIANCQEELEDRIRSREQQLSRLKRQVESKEKELELRDQRYLVQPGKLYIKGENKSFSKDPDDSSIENTNKNNEKDHVSKAIAPASPLRKEAKPVGEHSENEDGRTIEEISVVNDSVEGQTEDRGLAIEESPIKPFQPNGHANTSEIEETIEVIYPNETKDPNDSKEINRGINRSNSKGINNRSNNGPRNRSGSQGIKLYEETSKNEQLISKVKIMVPGSRSPKKIPQEKPQRRGVTNYVSNKESIGHGKRSSLIKAGESQFNTEEKLAKKLSSKINPLRTAKKWEYENEDSREISESGYEEELPNARFQRHAHMILPAETDKERTEFRINLNEKRVQGNSQMNLQTGVSKQTNQSSSNKQQVRSSLSKELSQQSNPLIIKMQSQQIPVKPLISQSKRQFGDSQWDNSAEQQIEYIGSSEDGKNNTNSLILNQMLSRPNKNQDIRKYYERHGAQSRNSSHTKQSNSRYETTEKIYLQKLQRK